MVIKKNQAWLFLGLLWSFNLYAAIVPCETVAQSAGHFFEARTNWVATSQNTSPEVTEAWTLQAEFKGWRIWQTPFARLEQCSPQRVKIETHSVLLYPVIWQSLQQKAAVVTGQLLIRARSESDLAALAEDYALEKQLSMPLPFSAVFVAQDVQDLDDLISSLQLSAKVIEVTPLLSYQRYRLR